MLLSFGVTFFLLSQTFAQTKPSSRPKECLSSNVTESVVRNIISKYPTWQRPVRNVSETIYVNVTFALSSISDIIEREKTVKLSAYLSIRWFDQLRIWDDSFPQNCVVYVVVPSETVWLPDVAMMNGDGRYLVMNAAGEKVRIHSDGYTIYSPGGTFIAYCEFDLRLFPFDVQLCAVKFESWRYTHPFMAFRFGKPNVRIFQWLENEQWELTGTSQALIDMSYMEPENRFDRMEFYLCLKRKSQFYVTSVIMPGLIISICQVAVFTLPLEESNKVYILFTCLLAYLVFLLMIASDMPRSSVNVPLLTIYVCVSMFLIAFSIFGEGLAFLFAGRANSLHPKGPGYVPNWFYVTSKAAAKFMRLHLYFPSRPVTSKHGDGGRLSSDTANKNERIGDTSNGRKYSVVISYMDSEWEKRKKDKEIEIARQQWRCVATVMDSLTLLIYAVAVCLAPIVLFGIIPLSTGSSLCAEQASDP